jgi:hypothetical protein
VEGSNCAPVDGSSTMQTLVQRAEEDTKGLIAGSSCPGQDFNWTPPYTSQKLYPVN